MHIDDSEAINLIQDTAKGERFCLFVWSLDKMGLWNVLKKIESMLPEIREAQYKKKMEKYGI
jgi:hypothetical protein